MILHPCAWPPHHAPIRDLPHVHFPMFPPFSLPCLLSLCHVLHIRSRNSFHKSPMHACTECCAPMPSSSFAPTAACRAPPSTSSHPQMWDAFTHAHHHSHMHLHFTQTCVSQLNIKSSLAGGHTRTSILYLATDAGKECAGAMASAHHVLSPQTSPTTREYLFEEGPVRAMVCGDAIECRGADGEEGRGRLQHKLFWQPFFHTYCYVTHAATCCRVRRHATPCDGVRRCTSSPPILPPSSVL